MLKILSTLVIATFAPMPASAQTSAPSAQPVIVPEVLSPNDIKITDELQSLETEIASVDSIADIATRDRLRIKLKELRDNYEKVRGQVNRMVYKDFTAGILDIRRNIENIRNPQAGITAPAAR